MTTTERVETMYSLARERYAELGVDADLAMERLSRIAI